MWHKLSFSSLQKSLEQFSSRGGPRPGPRRPWHLRSETENARKFHHMISPPTRISGDLIKKIQTHSNAEIHKGPCPMDFDCKAVFAILVLRYFLTVPNAQAVLCTSHPKPQGWNGKGLAQHGLRPSFSGGGDHETLGHIYIYISAGPSCSHQNRWD